MNDLEQKVNEHSMELILIKNTIENISKSLEKTSKELEKIANSITNQELILEKLSSIRENHDSSIKRIHYRIDNIEDKINLLYSEVEKTISKINSKINNFSSDIHQEPCNTLNVTNKEIEHLSKRLDMHQKIFWTVISTIGLGFIGMMWKIIEGKI